MITGKATFATGVYNGLCNPGQPIEELLVTIKGGVESAQEAGLGRLAFDSGGRVLLQCAARKHRHDH